MRGEVELDGKVLVLKRVHAHYRLTVDPDADRETVERVHGFHRDYCPVARSIHPQIEVTTSIEVVERGS